MKKTTKIISLILISIFVTLTIFGCSSSASATMPSISYPLHILVKSDKTNYALGEEITIEFLLAPQNREEYTYRVKLAESSGYEITDGNEGSIGSKEDGEIFKGEGSEYFYKYVFKIKVVDEVLEEHRFKFYIDCVESDWLKDKTAIPNHSDDIEYDMTLETGVGFTSNADGVVFPNTLFSQTSSTNKLPFWYGAILFLDEIIKAIKDFFAGLFNW